MKDSNHSFLKVVLAYCLVIGLVLLWSGNKREKTVFDKYLISFGGLALSCSHINSSSQFFREVLEFKEVDSHPNLFILPDRSSIALVEDKNITIPNIDIRLKVRNGIYNLHERLAKRVSNFTGERAKMGISEYKKTENDMQFSIVDPSGIKLTFYQTRAFAKGL